MPEDKILYLCQKSKRMYDFDRASFEEQFKKHRENCSKHQILNSIVTRETFNALPLSGYV